MYFFEFYPFYFKSDIHMDIVYIDHVIMILLPDFLKIFTSFKFVCQFVELPNCLSFSYRMLSPILSQCTLTKFYLFLINFFIFFIVSLYHFVYLKSRVIPFLESYSNLWKSGFSFYRNFDSNPVFLNFISKRTSNLFQYFRFYLTFFL